MSTNIVSMADMVEISTNAKELKGRLKTITYAMSEDKTKPVLCGINVRITNKEIILEATDGYRLAQTKLKFDFILNYDKEFNFQLTSEDVKKLYKFLPNRKTEKINLSIDYIHDKLYVYTSTDRLDLKIFMGEFLQLEKLLFTKDINHCISLNDSIRSILDVLKSDKTKIVSKNKLIELTIKGDNLNISYITKDFGKVSHDFNINNLNNTDFTIGFNVYYFIDLLGVIKDKSHELAFQDRQLNGVQANTSSDVHLLLPIKTINI